MQFFTYINKNVFISVTSFSLLLKYLVVVIATTCIALYENINSENK